MSANATPRKAHWLLGALLLSQVLLMSWNARTPGGEQSILRTWVMAVVTPVTKGASWSIDKVTGFFEGFAELRHAREQNAQLREQVERLTQERDEANERAAKQEHLESELGVPVLPRFKSIAANVVSRNVTIWFKRLTIDRGSMDGVKKDMPVLTSLGVVGRVIEVGPNSSLVQLITDRYAGVGAMLRRSRDMGEIKGQENSRCEMKNVSASVDVPIGETVVTTGLDGIYPKGLTVGTVESVDNDANAPWHKILIRPSAPVDKVEHVFVLLIEPRDLKTQEGFKQP